MKQNQKLPLESAEIEKILLHRYPFLLVDRVISADDESVVGYKNVTYNEPYFQGHFPGMPVMPGVLQIEAMAQLSCILSYLRGHFDPEKHVALFAGIDSAKFRRVVTPGDRFDMTASVISAKRSVYKLRCKGEVDGELAAEAVLIAVLKDK